METLIGKETHTPHRWPAWRDLLTITIAVVVGFVLRAGQMPVEGEESRRGQFAVEMLRSGDWVSTTQQGVPFIDRPPGQYWTIAASFALAGGAEPGVNAGVNRWSLRIPTLLSTWATALLAWWAARGAGGNLAGLVAGLAFATMGLTLDIGRRAETEAQFTCILGAAVLVWQHLYASGRSAWVHWTIGYTLCALAALTKGTQAPVTFCGAAGLLLLWRRDWRTLFSPGHALGIAVFLAVIAVWMIPFAQRFGWEGVFRAWFMQASQRTHQSLGPVLTNMGQMPIELFGAMLPWGVMLIGVATRPFWTRGTTRGNLTALHCVLTILVVFVPPWLVADARVRYAMPLLPSAAVLVGLVAARTAGAAWRDALSRLWLWSGRAMGLAVVGIGVFFVVATMSSAAWAAPLAQPVWWAGVQLLLAIGAGIWIASSATATEAICIRRGAVISALSLALLTGTSVANVLLKRANDVEPLVAQVRRLLPPGERLVSIRPIAHRFVYFWGEPIEVIPLAEAAKPFPPGVRYFAFGDFDDTSPPVPPFKWQQVARVCVDRVARPESKWQWVVTVGERLE